MPRPNQIVVASNAVDRSTRAVRGHTVPARLDFRYTAALLWGRRTSDVRQSQSHAANAVRSRVLAGARFVSRRLRDCLSHRLHDPGQDFPDASERATRATRIEP